ncbi:DUF1156 domain-containing protein [Rhizobium ruizarguesonis]
MLIAIVADGPRGRVYVAPSREHESVALSAEPTWQPETNLPDDPRNFWTVDYGLTKFGHLFTSRQLVALKTYSDLVYDARKQITLDALNSGSSDNQTPLRDGGEGSVAYADAVSVYLGLAIGRLADISNAHCNWSSSATQVVHLFGRQTIPMVWEFAEAGLFSNAAGDYIVSLNSIIKNLLRFVPSAAGSIRQSDAQSVIIPDGSVISTDPPYYDNIAYADLSDFFYHWLKAGLSPVYPELFGTLATPKSEELVATPYRHGGRDSAESFFLNGMRNAIKNIAAQATDEFPAAIYYAFKQSEVGSDGLSSTGWATFLQAVIEAGYTIGGTWPIRTERPDRMIASGKNALANSVVLVCRKKESAAVVVTRAEFIRALKRELPPAITELQAANIAPADMPQSAIGPGIGVFSRYKAVLEADDNPMSVKVALQLINRELDDYLGVIQGDFDPETRFAITWFEQHGMKAGDYGSADNQARARGIAVESVKHAGVVESAAGKVRLLGRDELDVRWDPSEDRHLTIWECLQHLVKLHEENGIAFQTAALFKQIGNQADAVKDLAYCLYDIAANKRKDAKEATAYNALIADWTELSREAAAVHDIRGTGQGSLEL